MVQFEKWPSSAAKAGNENTAVIAALKALRHPKSLFFLLSGIRKTAAHADRNVRPTQKTLSTNERACELVMG